MADFLNPGEGKRVPLSGSNSGHDTSGDCRNVGDLYVEVKYRAKHTTCSLHRDTREKAAREGKVAVSVLKEKSNHGFLLVIDSRDMDRFVDQYIKNRRMASIHPPKEST